ncbi:hypothetical protein [Streptomyces sp. NPDC002067]
MDEESKTDRKGKEKRIDLSVPQVAGSALAAACAAFLAGQLGVYGTIIGAGVVSIVATTGGSVFQHLFRRTGEQIKEATAATRPRPHGATRTSGPHAAATTVLPSLGREGAPHEATAFAGEPTAPVDTTRTQLLPRADVTSTGGDDAATRLLRRPGAGAPLDDATRALRTGPPPGATDRTQLVPRLDAHTVALGAAAAQDKSDGGAETAPFPGDETVTATYGTRLRGWRRPALGAVGIFVLAMGAVTGVEVLMGETASGGSGTTLGRLAHTGGSHRDTAPDNAPVSPTPDHSHGTGRDHNAPTGTPDTTTGPDSGSTPGAGGGADGGSSATTPAPTPSDGATPSSEPTTSEPTGPSGDKSGTGDTGTGDQDTGGKSAAQEPDPAPS